MTLRDPDSPDGVRMLLSNPRFEVLPFASFADQLAVLPAGASVAVTASPSLDIEATVEKAELAADRGFEPIPHLAARDVRDDAHLATLVERLRDAGVTDVFVPGGDRDEPLGAFESALDLLEALDGLDAGFAEVGITGYPEGHPFLDAETLAESMAAKLPYATYVATQLCYDADAILAWIEDARERGVDLPVYVGIPGVLSYQRLLSVSNRVGVGDSVRFLRKTTGVLAFLRRLVGSRGRYAPDDLVEGLARRATDPDYGIHGVHVYTFNEAQAFEDWRRDVLARHDAP